TVATGAFLTVQTIGTSIYLNLYRVPQIIETANTYLAFAAGAFEVMRLLSTNILNSAESYSRVPTIRGGQVEEAAQTNLDRSFPAFDHWDSEKGAAIQVRSTAQTSSPDALLNVIKRGVNRVNNVPSKL